jgi:hypothetical protein
MRFGGVRMLRNNQLSWAFILARQEGSIWIFRLDGLKHPPVIIRELPDTDILEAKAILVECARKAAQAFPVRVLEMPLHPKYWKQFRQWSKTVEVLSSKALTLVHGQ